MTETVSADYWTSHYFDAEFNRQEWQAHPETIQRQFVLQGGRMREEWFFKKYCGAQAVERAVSIGAGRAETELQMLVSGKVDHFDFYDIPPAGIEYAKVQAQAVGLGDRIDCHVVTPGVPAIPEGRYDLIMFVASLHHMPDITATLKSAYRGLKEGGYIFCANEYIGPDRFSYPKEHLRIVREFHKNLPAKFRKHGLPELVLPTARDVAIADPSEAEFSSQILPTMRKLFPTLEVTSLYGSFAFMLFWGLEHDALYETEAGRELVAFILNMDQSLVEAGILPDYFAHLVARKPTPGQSRALERRIDFDGTAHRALTRFKRSARDITSDTVHRAFRKLKRLGRRIIR
jgi:SAM-dependent methyltransferase